MFKQLSGYGLLFPFINPGATPIDTISAGSASNLIDAAGEISAYHGRVFIDGRPSGTKTLSAAGGGSISFLVSSATFANAGTTLRVGIQGVAATSTTGIIPDGVYSVQADLIGGTDTLTAGAWKTVTPTSGSVSLAHGDLISVVHEMVSSVGDSFRAGFLQGFRSGLPCGSVLQSGVYNSTPRGYTPCVVLTFDDGTIATLDGSLPISGSTSEAFADATNPDERGLAFQVQVPSKMDAIYMAGFGAGSNSDFTLSVYSDPFGTPTALYTANIEGAQFPPAISMFLHSIPVGSEVQLLPNTDYVVAAKATGTGNVTILVPLMGDATYRAFLPNGLTLSKATRNAGTGVFTADTTRVPVMGIRLSHFDDGTGGGRATFVMGA